MTTSLQSLTVLPESAATVLGPELASNTCLGTPPRQTNPAAADDEIARELAGAMGAWQALQESWALSQQTWLQTARGIEQELKQAYAVFVPVEPGEHTRTPEQQVRMLIAANTALVELNKALAGRVSELYEAL